MLEGKALSLVNELVVFTAIFPRIEKRNRDYWNKCTGKSMLHKCRTLGKLKVRQRHFCLQPPEANQWWPTESVGLSYNEHSCSGLHAGQLLTLLEC